MSTSKLKLITILTFIMLVFLATASIFGAFVDISYALPGLIITAVLLLRKHNLAYILAPIGLVFMIVLTIALAAMVIMTRIKGISEDASLAYIFIILSVISIIFLYGFLIRIKPSGN
ncbi:MAG: hypothetical protein KFF49_11125 [Bacteroidales bacterium]|nr:hypothetical protein [Bacteroidales bacterium]